MFQCYLDWTTVASGQHIQIEIILFPVVISSFIVGKQIVLTSVSFVEEHQAFCWIQLHRSSFIDLE